MLPKSCWAVPALWLACGSESEAPIPAPDGTLDAGRANIDAAVPDAASGSAADAAPLPADSGAIEAGSCASSLVASPFPACYACYAASCCAQAVACDGSPDYLALKNCGNDCATAGADDTCILACASAHAEGASLAASLNECVDQNCAHCGSVTATTSIRMAHLAPGAGAIDLCWRIQGAPSFDGPLLAQGQFPNGLANQEITAYVLTPPPGPIELRAVAAGGGCDAALASATMPVGIEEPATVVVLPSALVGMGLQLVIVPDAPSASSSAVELRFFHGARSFPAVDVGFVNDASVDVVFQAVPYGALGMGAPVSPAGVYTCAPFVDAELSIATSNTTRRATISAAGGPYTIFFTDSGAMAKVITCDDRSTQRTPFADCTAVGVH